VAREVISLHVAIKEVEEDAASPNSLLSRAASSKAHELGQIGQNCRLVLTELEKLVAKYRSLGTKDKKKMDIIRFATEGLESIRNKIAFHTSSINLFLASLGTGSLARIEKRLDEIAKDIQCGHLNSSIMFLSERDGTQSEFHWNVLKEQLLEEDLIIDEDLEHHREWIQERLHESGSGSSVPSSPQFDASEPPPISDCSPTSREQFLVKGEVEQNPSAEWNQIPFNPGRTLKRRASSPLSSDDNATKTPHRLRRADSSSRIGRSMQSDVAEYDSEGILTKRTVTTSYRRCHPGMLSAKRTFKPPCTKRSMEHGFPALARPSDNESPLSLTSAPYVRRKHTNATQLKAQRRGEIERRCLSLDPPLKASTLQNMDAFVAASQVPLPLSEAAWEILKPRIIAQRQTAEKTEREHEVLRSNSIPEPETYQQTSTTSRKTHERSSADDSLRSKVKQLEDLLHHKIAHLSELQHTVQRYEERLNEDACFTTRVVKLLDRLGLTWDCDEFCKLALTTGNEKQDDNCTFPANHVTPETGVRVHTSAKERQFLIIEQRVADLATRLGVNEVVMNI
jgi:hypothetical protein